MKSIPIDWATVNWLYVALLAAFVFVASIIGHIISFGRRGFGALLTALLFAAALVFWTYYPHGLPFLPTSITAKTVVTTAKPPTPPPPAPPAPVKPANPVTTISPPDNNSR